MAELANSSPWLTIVGIGDDGIAGLGDEAKRKQFDRGEIDAEGKPRFQGFPGGGGRARGGGGGFENFSFRTGPGGAGGGVLMAVIGIIRSMMAKA